MSVHIPQPIVLVMAVHLLHFLTVLTPPVLAYSVQHPERSPACRKDWDCLAITEAEGRDYRCFQYACLAWNETQVPEEQGTSTGSCYDDWDCEGEDRFCLKHSDPSVEQGVCVLHQGDLARCREDGDCLEGSECLPPGACGPPSYRALLEELPCHDDSECWLERGDLCCYDFSHFHGEKMEVVTRRCCRAEEEVALIPPQGYGWGNISRVELARLESYGDCLATQQLLLTLTLEEEEEVTCRHNFTSLDSSETCQGCGGQWSVDSLIYRITSSSSPPLLPLPLPLLMLLLPLPLPLPLLLPLLFECMGS